jgi:hypothetical protein
MKDASPGVVERYSEDNLSTSEEGEERRSSKANEHEEREETASPSDANETPESVSFSPPSLKLPPETPFLDALEDSPSTPPKSSEEFVSPKSFSLSPNIKAIDHSAAKKSATRNESRRKQLIGHTANLWQILDEICEHSTLTEEELSGTTDRIKNLKAMNEELGKLESEMEILQSVYTYESRSYLKKLRQLEKTVYAPAEESKDSFGQAALDRSFSRSVFKILYDDRKGQFQLVSAKLEDNSRDTNKTT